jgi:hypothetical protein
MLDFDVYWSRERLWNDLFNFGMLRQIAQLRQSLKNPTRLD